MKTFPSFAALCATALLAGCKPQPLSNADFGFRKGKSLGDACLPAGNFGANCRITGIQALPGMATTRGVHLGSTRQAVEAAYGRLDTLAADTSGNYRLVVPVGTDSTDVYWIHVVYRADTVANLWMGLGHIPKSELAPFIGNWSDILPDTITNQAHAELLAYGPDTTSTNNSGPTNSSEVKTYTDSDIGLKFMDLDEKDFTRTEDFGYVHFSTTGDDPGLDGDFGIAMLHPRNPRSLDSAFQDELKTIPHPSLNVKKDGWWVLSGIVEGKIIYAKCITSPTSLAVVEVRYPTSSRPKMDPLVTRFEKSFRFE